MRINGFPCLAALAGTLALLALPAAADSGCFRRTVDFSELRSDPARQVTEIALGPAGPLVGGVMPVVIEVWTRDANARFVEWAECRDSDPVVCLVDGEQGAFTLEAHAEGLRLTPGNHGASLFNQEGVISLWADGGPDGTFVMYPVGSEMCPEPPPGMPPGAG